MYIRRSIENTIIGLGNSFPCIVVYGPRQVGKSTTLDYIFPEDIRRVSLDDLDSRNLAMQNPRLFLEMNPWPVIIDEIQKVPELLDEIKLRIDNHIQPGLVIDSCEKIMPLNESAWSFPVHLLGI